MLDIRVTFRMLAKCVCLYRYSYWKLELFESAEGYSSSVETVGIHFLGGYF